MNSPVTYGAQSVCALEHVGFILSSSPAFCSRTRFLANTGTVTINTDQRKILVSRIQSLNVLFPLLKGRVPIVKQAWQRKLHKS